MVGYRQQIRAEFTRMYPDLQISEQRIADEYRVLLRNNLISETRLNNIKQEEEREISPANSETVLEGNNQIDGTSQPGPSTEAQIKDIQNEQNQGRQFRTKIQYKKRIEKSIVRVRRHSLTLQTPASKNELL
ncbi:hypothetical protein HHI36_000930 [Cryptolaemus montrouzieri]|uniref:Uncharacterized protein n=1 Tax=Cryptolaemus montrouzieri TaxID=559131 RepID=A0ABD2P6S8_9CUCU